VVAAPVDICHPRSVELRGAVTVVTGASRGVGRATAVLLATHGATVVWAGRDEAALYSLAERWGGSVAVADLAEDTGAGELLCQTLAEHGRLDAVGSTRVSGMRVPSRKWHPSGSPGWWM